MPRTKPNIPLLSRDQVDAELRLCAIDEAELARLKADADIRITAIRDEFKKASAAYVEELKQIKEKVIYHLLHCRANFKTIRTLVLRFGRIGFRKVREDKINVSSTADAIASLKALGFTDCIRIKEEVDKDALFKRGPEAIAQVKGLSFPEEEEEPWFEAFAEPDAR